MCVEKRQREPAISDESQLWIKDNRERMLVAGMRKLCRFCLAAVLATALCVLTLVDMPLQLPESPTDPPPTPERESPGTRSIVAYSWARRLALDYRPSRQCRDELNDVDGKIVKSSSSHEHSNDFLNSNGAEAAAAAAASVPESVINDVDRSKKWLETIPKRLFLYSAHLDIRVAGYPSVRVIGVKRETPTPLIPTTGTLYCTIWHEDLDGRTKSFSMEALVSDIWLDEWGGSRDGYTGILVTCQLPRTNGINRVHVGSTSCYQNPSHSLLVNKPSAYSKNDDTEMTKTRLSSIMEKRRKFTLCIKGLDFDEDISEKLVAFVELNRILGADMIYIYVFNVHSNVSRVLRMYEKSNVVRWFNLELPGDLPNDVDERRQLFTKDVWIKRRMELIPYNHCFYENIYTSEFVIPIDIDETIVPVKSENWSELLNNERKRLDRTFEDFASYAVRNVYFFTELQNKVYGRKSLNGYFNDAAHSLSDNNERDSLTFCYLDTVRTSMISPIGDSIKSFISTDRALTVHNHYALTTLDPSTRRAYHLDPRDALKHHHRMCDDRQLDCDLMMEEFSIDETALRYENELRTRMKISMERLLTVL